MTKPVSPMGFETRAVRDGTMRSEFGEHSEALYLTSSFVFDDAEEAARRFQNLEPGMVYSRFTNPSVQMFEQRLASLEEAQDCVATASGMSAILSVCLGLLKSGDEIVTTGSLFGATIQLFDNFMTKFGVGVKYVDLSRPEEWEAAISPATRLFYLETPSNPLTQVADLQAIGTIARKAGVITVVDNCFCTPAIQQPLRFPIDLVLHSATKYLDGQGRVLGGAVAGPKSLVDQIRAVVRTCGPCLSAFNAWVLHRSMETLALRMRAHSESALALAAWLEQHPSVARVFYPGLASHPQHALAMRQQSSGGAIVSFELKADNEGQAQERAFRLVNAVSLFSRTGNLGDTRSIITHPASTTHQQLTDAEQLASGVLPAQLRISAGIEHIDDIKADLTHAFDAVYKK